jgi:hypothetical protein
MSEWINVKNRLPVKEGYYLTYCYGSIQIQRFGFIYESGIKKTNIMDWIEHGHSYLTTHWQELPEYPKE